MTALAEMIFTDPSEAQKAINALEPLVDDTRDDQVRGCALLAAFGVLKKLDDRGRSKRLVQAASRDPGPFTLNALARTVFLHRALLNDEALRIALAGLEAIKPEHAGTVQTIDVALRQLLGTASEGLALDFLTAKLRDEKLCVENFATTAHELTSGNPQRLYELIVRWFISGNTALCRNASKLVGIDRKRSFDTTVRPLGLSAEQQLFLCRKAIGFLFLKPVACCSIIVSILRAGNKDVEGPAAELLFNPILLNYGGDAKDYLKGIPATDPAYRPVQNALAKDAQFRAELMAIGTIKELHPSEYQRDVVRQQEHDVFRTAYKRAESKSVLLALAHRSTMLYGKRSLTYITDSEGAHRAIMTDLASFETSVELPLREILDPVGLDYMLRLFQTDKLR